MKSSEDFVNFFHLYDLIVIKDQEIDILNFSVNFFFKVYRCKFLTFFHNIFSDFQLHFNLSN